MGHSLQLVFPKALRREEGTRQDEEEEKIRRMRQGLRANSPRWLPGPFWVVLNGPEQR